MDPRRYRAGESIEDFCRVCKTDRMHTVVAADTEGRPIRVDCGYCHSEHNYRGGARIGVTGGYGGPERPALHRDADSRGAHPSRRSAGLSGPPAAVRGSESRQADLNGPPYIPVHIQTRIPADVRTTVARAFRARGHAPRPAASPSPSSANAKGQARR